MLSLSQYSRYVAMTKLQSSYYGISIRPHALFSWNDAYSQKMCRGFICRHFKGGMKKQALIMPFKDEYKKSTRHIHMVSLYLLGIYLYSCFSDAVATEFNRNIPHGYSWYDFKYTWFLTCLYHDTVSCIEKTTIPSNSTKEQKELGYHLRNLSIENSPYDSCVLKNPRISFRGSDSLASAYFHHRACQGSLDHGIIGGYLLYDRLLKSFIKKTKNHDWLKQPIMVDEGRHLVWRRDHIDHFSYIADAIICHNMWTVPSNDEKGATLYRRYNLDELIIDPSQRLSIDRFPLQFMLCLLDSIEPVKRFRRLSAREVLENTSITSIGNRSIRVEWSSIIKQDSDFWTWMKNIYNMKEWMSVDVSPCSHEDDVCSLIITINASRP